MAFPTETVYGLGANAFSAAAVSKVRIPLGERRGFHASQIFAIKRRPADNPLIVHVADETMLALLVTHISPQARLLMARFWPGPLTLLFPKSAVVPDKCDPVLSCNAFP